MADKVCLITGVGPGTGTALVKRFAEGGYRIAMLARNEERLSALTDSVGNTHAFPCDVAEEQQLKETLARVKGELDFTRPHASALPGPQMRGTTRSGVWPQKPLRMNRDRRGRCSNEGAERNE